MWDLMIVSYFFFLLLLYRGVGIGERGHLMSNEMKDIRPDVPTSRDDTGVNIRQTVPPSSALNVDNLLNTTPISTTL